MSDARLGGDIRRDGRRGWDPESDDDKAKGRRGQKTGQNAHTPTPIPQHVLDRAWRTTEEALFNPPWPPSYRRQLERLNRKADARKKAERDETDDEKEDGVGIATDIR